MDLHAIGINDSQMYFNYGLICVAVLAATILIPLILNILKVNMPEVAMRIMKVIGLLSTIGLLVCIIMYAVEKLR